ncbi:hypothetical protein EBR56_07855 [bacterium]|nr:hypothetical protein [bacterium]
MDTIRPLLFTTLRTAIRAAPLPKLSRWVERGAGLIPFAAFGLVWLASIGTIPRRWRLATIWVMPAVALASIALERIA